MVQQHDATSSHFDFRLEVEGVLASWALPKGPSVNPADKRLALPTEDHPLDYGEFEGVIPEGEYGAGTVLVWDAGMYQNQTERRGEPVPIEQALGNGHAVVWLDGDKLTGGFALTRIRTGRNEAWLLVKRDDDHANARANPVRTKPRSVRSGQTLKQIAGD